MNEPETLIDAVRYYADRKTCFETMLSVKWPDGKIVCPKCHGELIENWRVKWEEKTTHGRPITNAIQPHRGQPKKGE